ncbi:MAG: hypothetical protein WCP03_03295, partial [Candidatus Saccharibacteria bacterium]
MHFRIKKAVEMLKHFDRKFKRLAEKIFHLKWHHKTFILITTLLIITGLTAGILFLSIKPTNNTIP